MATLTGTQGNDIVFGQFGDDVIVTGAGNDTITDLFGNNVFDAGSGSDTVFAGAGNDLFIHRFGENVGARDYYDGGAGQDTLRLVFTSAEWARADVRADISAFFSYQADYLNKLLNPIGFATSFTFKSMNLTVLNIEALQVSVDGLLVDPHAAVIGDPTSASVREDANVSAGGLLTASGTIAIWDADQGQAYFVSHSGAAGNLGSLSFQPDGSYTYSVANSAVQYLGAGQTKVDSFTVVAGDGTSKQVSFTITGTNDAAVIGNPTVAGVTEDTNVSGGFLFASGRIAISDADQGQAQFVPLLQNTYDGVAVRINGGPGNLGGLNLRADGSYDYQVANSAVQYLGAGQTKTDTFTVTSLDGTSKQVSFTITGLNDAAVIGAPTVSSVTEDVNVSGGYLVASGTIAISDPDQGQAYFVSHSGAAGNLGTMSFQPDGSYTYSVANSAVQYLGAGQTKVDSFTVVAGDGTQKTVSFTIIGQNDAAVIGAPTVSSVTEDVNVSGGYLVASGTIAISDPDQGQAYFVSHSGAAGNLGTLAFVPDGSYTYSVANSAVQYLGAGQTKVDSFTVVSADGTQKTVSFTIIGQNDAAVIGAPTVSSVTEDVNVSGGYLVASGTIAVSDADQGQAYFVSHSGAAGNLGSLSFQPDGSYTYSVANSAVQYLGAGQTKVDTFTVVAGDGTSKQVSFTITGTNDAAVIGNSTVAGVTEDLAVNGQGYLTATGTIAISDTDQGQAYFVSHSGAAGNLGMLAFVPDGSYTYSVANSAVQYLGAGQTKVDSFTVVSADGTQKTVSFTIIGQNDAAVIGTPTVSTVTEDVNVSGGYLVASGTIAVSDPDQGQAYFVSHSGAAGNLGTMSFQPDGSYTYSVANSAVQYLGAGQTKVDSFTVVAGDGTQKTVSFTIIGQNDAAVIGAPTVAAVTEDVNVNSYWGTVEASGQLAISDADQGQASFRPAVYEYGDVPGTLGRFWIQADGTYTYAVLNSAVQYLGAGQTRVDTFTVTSLDGTTKQVSFTITGTNDAPVVSAAATTGSVTEQVTPNGNLTSTGSIGFTDADLTDAHTVTASAIGTTLGTLTAIRTADTTGTGTGGQIAWSYAVADSQVEYLAAGQSKVESFTVTVDDGHGGVATKRVDVTITGTNDAAVIGTPTISAVTEDTGISTQGNLTAAGTIAISDADQGEASFRTSVTSARGNLGSLVLQANGAYTYSVANSAVQYLGAGDTKVDTFIVTSFDGTTKQVAFTIAGQNDAAVIGTPTVSAVTEDIGVNGQGNLTAVGTISIADADQGQSSSFKTTVTGMQDNLGSLVLQANGAYTYSVPNSAVQFLDANTAKIDYFTVTALDGTTKQVVFTIQGTNDAAVIGTPTVSTVMEDTNVNGGGYLTATGTISIADADYGQPFFQTSMATAQGNLGTLTLAGNGSYTYAVADSAVQYLGAGETKVDTFTVTSLDGTTQQVSFTINGTNDAPVVAADAISVHSLSEQPGVTGSSTIDGSSATLTFSDLDLSDTHTVTATLQSLRYVDQLPDSQLYAAIPRALSVAMTDSTGTGLGSVTATFRVVDNLLDFLGAGQSVTATYIVTVADNSGSMTTALATQYVTFVITGTNDAPVIGTPTVSAVTEDTNVNVGGNLTATGTIGIADADYGQSSFQTDVTAAQGNLGSLTLAADGSYTYSVANNDVQYLGAGATKTDMFTVAAFDGTTKQVAFTITGTNDDAVIGDPTTSPVTEDVNVSGGSLIAAGTIAISDADQGQSSFQTSVVAAQGNLGSLVLQANGAYTYSVANGAAQYLGAGDAKVDTFTVTSFDGTTKQVSFTINGTNDAAVIGNPTVSTVAEDVNASSGSLIATGTISIRDDDQGQSSFQTTVTAAQGNLGSLVLQANGGYTYRVANGAVQYLGSGDTRTDTFTVTGLDGTTKQVAFTITGANDVAVIGNPTVSSVTEDLDVASGLLSAFGTISIRDDDQGQASFQTTVAAAQGNLGSLVLQANGAYTYSVDNSAVQYLGAGDTKVDTFTVTSFDGTTKQVSFTINGADDAAVIATPTVTDVTEDVNASSGSLIATGTIAVSDLDQGQASFQTSVAAAQGNLGTLVLQASGGYTYRVLNSAAQYLGSGDTKTDTFTVTALDGTTKQVAFTINGANDAAVIGNPTVSSVTEDVNVASGLLSVSGAISIRDDDQGQASFQTTVVGAQGNLGSLTLAANGSYTYAVANAAVQYLGAGDTKVDTFTVISFDGTTKQVAFTIAGQNDAAVIGSPTVSSVTEDVNVSGSALFAYGTIAISDVDQNQASFQTTVTPATGNLGVFSLAPDGGYTYGVANSAVQYLGAGATKTDTFTVTAFDGTAKDIAFTINGADDAAVIGDPTVSSVTEDVNVSGGNLTASGIIAISDADKGQSSFRTTVTAAQDNLGSLSIERNGAYTYTVANSIVQYLGAGATKTDTFTVTAFDGTTKDIAFTINGADDAAVIGDPTVSSVTEDVNVSGGNLTASGIIAISDADKGQSSFRTTVTAAQDNLGSLSIERNGAYTYTVANSIVQYLGAGATKTDTFTVTSFDGTTKDIAFTINGADDAAVIGDPTVSSVTEDVNVSGGNLTASGIIAISDADKGQSSFRTTVTAAQDNLGSLSIERNGAYTYTVANSIVQYLGAGATKTDTFTVTAFDGTTKDIAFTINGADDAAVIGDPTVSSVTEDVNVSGGNLTASGIIAISDADKGQSSFRTTVTAAQDNLGSLSIERNGAYTYTVANTSVQYLGAGATKIDTFTVTSFDGTTTQVSFTINGTDDAPLIKTATTVASGSVNVPLTGVTAVGYADLTRGNTLVNGLGGVAGFGEQSLPATDDDSSAAINITSVFGAAGLNFFGHTYTSLYVNNNGNITFAGANSGYTPTSIDAGVNNPIIAAFWADVDTRAGAGTTTPGGTSNGANAVYYDLDAANGVFTVTWDDVGYYNNQKDKLNAFQLQLVNEGGGNFDIVYRYENINWTIAQSSGQAAAQARVGYSAGINSVNYYELPGSGTQAGMSALPTKVGNTGIAGVDVFNVRNGNVQPTTLTQTGTIDFTDVDLTDVHTIQSVTYTGAGTAIGGLTLTKTTDTTGSGLGGEFAWTYKADQATAQQALAAAGGGSKVETFNVVIGDGHGGTVTQTVTVTLLSGDNPVVLAGDTVASHAMTEIANVTGGAGFDTARATLAFVDRDLRDTHSVSQSLLASTWSKGTVPGATQTALASALSLTKNDVDASGTGSVTATFALADRLADFLAAGETLSATYSITVDDGHGSTSTRPVTFTITGTNDAPVLAADTAASHALSEQAGLTGATTLDTASGTLAFTDADLIDTHGVTQGAPSFSWSGGQLTQSQIATLTSAGTLTLTETDSTNSGTGSVGWVYSIADGTLDFLSQGQTLTASYTVTVTDNNHASATQTVTATINGTDDPATLAAAAGSAVRFDGQGYAYAYSPNPISTAYTVEATFNTATSAGSVVKLAGQRGGLVLAVGGSGPSLSQDGNGTITAQLGAVADGVNHSVALTYDVGSSYGGSGKVTLYLDGSVAATATFNSFPILSYEYFGLSGFNGTIDNLRTWNTLRTPTQIAADAAGVDSSSPGLIGNFTFDGDSAGTYTFANSASGPDAFGNAYGTGTLVSPGTPATIVEQAGVTGSTQVDTTGATLTLTDPDLADHHTVTAGDPTFSWSGGTLTQAQQTALKAASSLSLNLTDSTGSGAGSLAYTYGVTDGALDFLAAGDTLTVGYTLVTDNGHGGVTTTPISLTVQGADDAPVAVLDTYATTKDAAPVDLNVLANDGDVDLPAGAHLTIASFEGTTSLGATVTLNADGTLHYDPGTSGAIQNLPRGGASVVDTFNYVAADERGVTSQSVQVRVTVVNDEVSPVFAGPGALSLAERPGTTGSSAADTAQTSLAFTEANLGDTHGVSANLMSWTTTRSGNVLPSDTLAALQNALTVSVPTDSTGTGTGSILPSFSVPDSVLDYLAVGQTLTASYGVAIDDGHGGTAQQTVSIAITGANDNAVISVADRNNPGDRGSLTEDAASFVSDKLVFTDADLADSHAVSTRYTGSGSAIGSLTASVSKDTTGTGTGGEITWVYTPDPTKIDALRDGERKVETFDVALNDGTSTVVKSVSITLTGTNDAPVVTGPVNGIMTRNGGPVTLKALANASDADYGTVLSVVRASSLPDGVTYDAATKTFTLDPSSPNMQTLFDHGPGSGFTISYGVIDGITTTDAFMTWTVGTDADAGSPATLSGSFTQMNAALDFFKSAGNSIGNAGAAAIAQVTGGAAAAQSKINDLIGAGTAGGASALVDFAATLKPLVAALVDQVNTGATGFLSTVGKVNDAVAAALDNFNTLQRNDILAKTPGIFDQVNANIQRIANSFPAFASAVSGIGGSVRASQDLIAAAGRDGTLDAVELAEFNADLLNLNAGLDKVKGSGVLSGANLVAVSGQLTDLNNAFADLATTGFDQLKAETDLKRGKSAFSTNSDVLYAVLDDMTKAGRLDSSKAADAKAALGNIASVIAGLTGDKSADGTTVSDTNAKTSAAVNALVGNGGSPTPVVTEQVVAGLVTLSDTFKSQTIVGTSGNDLLHGGAGNDTINGLGGNDVLYGGAGSNTFVFTPGAGQDRIADFTVGGTSHDVLDLSAYRFGSLANVIANILDLSPNPDGSLRGAIIGLTGTDSITLTGVTRSDLLAHPEDFRLA